MQETPWQKATGASGAHYDDKFKALQHAGQHIHGEADFVASFGVTSVVDAGCGTGRLAIELARRGINVIGVDRERNMLRSAQEKAPHLTWHLANLATVQLNDPMANNQLQLFEAIVMAGNVMIFIDPGTARPVMMNLARHLAPAGLLISGFQLQQGLCLDSYDDYAKQAGLHLKERWATWDRKPWYEGCDYAVSVHYRPS
ncbi:MAG: class I SAM-dependent methyltransferase [bacterium]|nr:class I SAM-dependent methyltransferase [bacterium]